MGPPRLLLLVLALLTPCGCISTGRLARVWYVGASGPPSPARVEECRAELAQHNDWTVAAASLGVLAGSSASLEAVAGSQGTKTGLVVEAAVSGILAAVATSIAGTTGASYAADDCQAVLTAAP
jgi:hypothetical protein